MAYAPIYRVQLVREGTIRYRIRDEQRATEVLREVLVEQRGDRETMAVIYLDSNGGFIGVEIVGIGGKDAMTTTAREVFTGAVAASAHAVVLGHNHPSGSSLPSDSDDKMTATIKQAGDVLGIPLLDHIIVTHNDNAYSYLANGRL